MVLDAASEALANGLKLIVVVTERLPRADGLVLLERARSAGARVVGPNSLGLITPGQTRVGMAGGDAASVRMAYQPGSIGVVSRSGGMMTEIANLLTLSGFGQSTCVSIGGDQFIGTRFEDLLPLYPGENDERLLARISAGEVVLKRGEPASIVRVDGKAQPVKAEPVTRPVVDTTAAGDSFAAAYVAARLNGTEPAQAARAGHRLAGVVVCYPGAIIPREAMPARASK